METLSFRRLFVLLVVVMTVLAAGPGLAAAETRVGGTVVVAEGETTDGLEAVGGTVIVRGTVAGDVAGTAGTVVIERTGVVEGDLSVAAGSVQISGEVRGDVSIGAGSVYVDRTGVVLGEFTAGAGTVLIDGRLAGPAEIGADSITVGSTAVVEEGIRYDAADIRIADGAAVSGEVVRDESISGVERSPFVFEVPSVVVAAYGILANLVLGAFLLLIFPRPSRRIADAVAGTPLRSAGVGIAALVLVPVALVVVALTIVGIPLAIAGSVLFGLTVWVALVYGQFAVATWALSRTDVDNRWAALVLGVVGLGILGAIPVLGGFLDFAVVLLGLGALALLSRDGYRTRRRSAPAVEQQTLDEYDGRPS